MTTRKMMGEYILYADGKIFGEASGCDAPGTACCESEEEINDGLRSAILYTLLVMPVGISFSVMQSCLFFLTKSISKQMECARFPLGKGIIGTYENCIPHYIVDSVVWLFRSRSECIEGQV
ncbi:MAG: hypothetical protein SPL33_01110 [Fibrobacter sp.]|nr:hypothetical protein [Fibrobacter sp.]MDY6370509.1 hypothetical protein [Fibrobacter sp.]